MRNLKVTRPSQVEDDAAFPVAGKAKNIIVEGDNKGTPWVDDVINDRIFGWQENVLQRTGIVASGNPEDISDSQIAQAIAIVGAVKGQGRDLAGSTRYGCTLNSDSEWVIHTDGSFWQWNGSYPKVVAINEIPSSPSYKLKLLQNISEFGLGDSLPDPIDDFNNVGSLGTGFYRTINGSLNNPLDVVQGNLLNMRREAGDFGEIDGSQFLIGKTTTDKVVAAFRFAYDVNASTVPFIELYHTDNFAPVINLTSTEDTIPLAASQGKVLADTKRDITNKVFQRTTTTTMENSSDDSESAASFYSSTGDDSFISLHSNGVFGFNFGYSDTLGKIAVGGWSLGNNVYEIYHAGNTQPTVNSQFVNSASPTTVTFDSIVKTYIVTRHTASDNTITLNGTIKLGDELIVTNALNGTGVATITGKDMLLPDNTTLSTVTFSGRGTATFICTSSDSLTLKGVN